MVTKSPSKQRKSLYNAPMHMRRKQATSKLSKGLAKEMGRRSLGLRKGDEVKVMRGDSRGITGKVTRVDLKKAKIYVDTVKRKKVSGEEVQTPLHASNLMIIKAEMADKKRLKTLGKKKVK